jgi:SAM-dependent methyltransferase
MAPGGPFTSTDLADKTGTNERYAREWLEEQAVAGIIEVDNPDGDPKERTFRLPLAHAEVLANRESLNYFAPQIRLGISCVRLIDQVLAAFRSGGGVSYADYGPDMSEGLSDGTRLAFLEFLASEWLPADPELHARLQADPPARVADIGVGGGWSSIAIARGYPKVTVDGFDLDPASVEIAKRNVADAGLSDRVRIQARDAADPGLTGQYDVALAFSCIHDMSDPVAALRSMRRLTGDDGLVLVGGETNCSDDFLGAGTNYRVERQGYGASILHCLPVAMSEQPSAAAGTVMRPAMLREFAQAAGFRDIRKLPIEDEWTAFYRLLN